MIRIVTNGRVSIHCKKIVANSQTFGRVNLRRNQLTFIQFGVQLWYHFFYDIFHYIIFHYSDKNDLLNKK